jgi:PTS system mannose-specific IIA component
MIGLVIVTHSHLGEALIEAAEFIIGNKPEATVAVSIDLKINAEILRKKITDAIKSVNHQKGIIIMTDMFGGTPSNLGYSFLEEGRVEVISGINLPILIKAANAREKMGLIELAQCLETYGKRSISLGSAILKGNKRCE